MKSIKKGYSLIELAIVVLVVSLVSIVVMPVEHQNTASGLIKAETVNVK